jgi:hypothetical protein
MIFAPSVVVSVTPAVFVILIPDIDSFGRFALVFPVFVVSWFVYDRRAGGNVGAAMILTIAGYIHIPVPTVIDEINRPAAGAVFVAVPVPVFYMTGRHPKIDRRIPGLHPPDNDRFFIDQARCGVITDVDATVKAGLPYTDRHSGIGLT